MSLQPTIELPAGVALPSDAEAARALIEREVEQAQAEQRATQFLLQREQEQATPVEFVI